MTTKLDLCILVSGYRNSMKGFVERSHNCDSREEVVESIKEMIADINRAEEHFKINEGKDDEQ